MLLELIVLRSLSLAKLHEKYMIALMQWTDKLLQNIVEDPQDLEVERTNLLHMQSILLTIQVDKRPST